MPRPKRSASVRISPQQLESIVGDGGVVCVSKAWLRQLGFDADIGKHAEVLGVHADGKQVWSYSEWASEEIKLRADLAQNEKWAENNQRLITLAKSKKKKSAVEIKDLESASKKMGLTADGYKTRTKEFVQNRLVLVKRYQARAAYCKDALERLKA